jgi:hypothetical protein
MERPDERRKVICTAPVSFGRGIRSGDRNLQIAQVMVQTTSAEISLAIRLLLNAYLVRVFFLFGKFLALERRCYSMCLEVVNVFSHLAVSGRCS